MSLVKLEINSLCTSSQVYNFTVKPEKENHSSQEHIIISCYNLSLILQK